VKVVDQDADVPDRARIGRLVGMLGSSSEGERANALAAVDKALSAATLSWGWLAHLVERGELPADRDPIFKRLVCDRLREGLVVAWSMGSGDAGFVRDVLARVESGSTEIDFEDVDRALNIATTARRRAR
jgi:hypothetical protein